MKQAVSQYLLSIVAAAMLFSLTRSILPKGAVRRIAEYVGGLLVIIAVLAPVVQIEYDSLARSIMRIQIETNNIKTETIDGKREVMADIIKQQCQTYIWDKANELGAELEVEVILNQDQYPYPIAVILTGKATPEQRHSLTEFISRDMGISAQGQEWNLR